MSASAGVCAECGGVVPPMDRIEGTERGHCPDCDREVSLGAGEPKPKPRPQPGATPQPAAARRKPPVLRPMPLPSDSVAVTRVAAPERPAAPVDLGPYRTAAHRFIEKRAPGSLTIEVTLPHTGSALAIGVFAAALSVMLALGPSRLGVVALIGGCVAIAWSEIRNRIRLRLELTPTLLIGSAGALPRDRITNLHCVDEEGGEIRRVEATAGGVRQLLIRASRSDAPAIAALLARELGLPPWMMLAAGDDRDR